MSRRTEYSVDGIRTPYQRTFGLIFDNFILWNISSSDPDGFPEGTIRSTCGLQNPLTFFKTFAQICHLLSLFSTFVVASHLSPSSFQSPLSLLLFLSYVYCFLYQICRVHLTIHGLQHFRQKTNLVLV